MDEKKIHNCIKRKGGINRKEKSFITKHKQKITLHSAPKRIDSFILCVHKNQQHKCIHVRAKHVQYINKVLFAKPDKFVEKNKTALSIHLIVVKKKGQDPVHLKLKFIKTVSDCNYILMNNDNKNDSDMQGTFETRYMYKTKKYRNISNMIFHGKSSRKLFKAQSNQ